MNPKPPQLYTKTGDLGTTSLISKDRLPKSSPIFHLLGYLDELNATLGLAVLHSPAPITRDLHRIQHTLLDIGSILAGSPQPNLTKHHLNFLQKKIDHYQQLLGPDWLQSFVLPGGSPLAAHLDLTRAVCRRTERIFHQTYSLTDPTLSSTNPQLPLIAAYLNRLSDYLFALRAATNHLNQIPEILHQV